MWSKAQASLAFPTKPSSASFTKIGNSSPTSTDDPGLRPAPTPMQITQIEAIPVRVPLKAGLTTRTAHGEHAVSQYVIVRIHTDSSLVGLGEATVAPRWSGETS